MYNQQTLFEALKPFAGMVIDQSKGVTVSDLTFASAQDFYSTCNIPFTAGTLVIGAGSTQNLFQNDVGQLGQGYAIRPLDISTTNNRNGNKMQANNVYIATHLGWSCFGTSTVNEAPIPIDNAMTMWAATNNMSWSLEVGGGILRTLGLIREYPAGSGASVGGAAGGTNLVPASVSLGNRATAANGALLCPKRKLPIPIVFPPNITVAIAVTSGGAVTVLDNLGQGLGIAGGPVQSLVGGGLAYKATFTGFQMTLPV